MVDNQVAISGRRQPPSERWLNIVTLVMYRPSVPLQVRRSTLSLWHKVTQAGDLTTLLRICEYPKLVYFNIHQDSWWKSFIYNFQVFKQVPRMFKIRLMELETNILL